MRAMLDLLKVLSTGLALWICRAIYRIYFHPLSRYPGPKLAAVSNSWWEWYWNYYKNGCMIFEIDRLHQKLGPVIRIGVNDLHISDHEVYQDIFKTNTSFIKDAEFYQYISFPGTSIGETDPEKHRIRRKVLAPALSGTRIQELAPLIESKSVQLLARFEKSASQYGSASAPICINSAAKAFTMDIISKIVLGEELGCIAEPNFRSELSDHLQAAFSMGWIGPSFPLLSSIALWISQRVPVSVFPMPHLKFKQSCAAITKRYLERFGTTDSAAATHSPLKISTSRGERSAVIDMLMDPTSARGHHIPTLDELGDELTILLTAGSDTSSNAIISGIYYICSHADIYQRLSTELQDTFSSLDENITYENAKNLPYLTAVIKETLRIGHPLPGRLPRVVPLGGYQLYGHPIKPGVKIHSSAYILNRQADVWENPNEFEPARWISDRSVVLDKQLATFGRGARGCLGKDLAWCELWVLFANLFRRFHIELAPYTPKNMEWVDIVLVHYTQRLFVTVEKRSR